jgi:hypothetical protein
MDLETNWHGSPETEVTVSPTRVEIAAALQLMGSRFPASVIKLHLHPGTAEKRGVWLSVTGCNGGWAIGLYRPKEYRAARFPVALCESDDWVSWFVVSDVVDFPGGQVCRDGSFVAAVVQHFAETGELSPEVEWQRT